TPSSSQWTAPPIAPSGTIRTLSWKFGTASPPALSATKPLLAERRKRRFGASARAGFPMQSAAISAVPASCARIVTFHFGRIRLPSSDSPTPPPPPPPPPVDKHRLL